MVVVGGWGGGEWWGAVRGRGVHLFVRLMYDGPFSSFQGRSSSDFVGLKWG